MYWETLAIMEEQNIPARYLEEKKCPYIRENNSQDLSVIKKRICYMQDFCFVFLHL